MRGVEILLQQFGHQPFLTGAAIFCGHMDLCAGPLKINDTQQVSLRSPAEKDGHLRFA
jgi:hypothetical protein